MSLLLFFAPENPARSKIRASTNPTGAIAETVLRKAAKRKSFTVYDAIDWTGYSRGSVLPILRMLAAEGVLDVVPCNMPGGGRKTNVYSLPASS